MIKSKYAIGILFLLMLGLMSSCDKDDLEFDDDFKRSEKAWKAFKGSSGNTYKYVVRFQSWTGSGSETIITVTDGKVVRREFKYTGVENLPENFPEEDLAWVENESELGKHQYVAAEPLTLDEIYRRAENEWLVKQKNAKTYFKAENNGMLSSAGYVEDGCADDCFRGIKIDSITAGN